MQWNGNELLDLKNLPSELLLIRIEHEMDSDTDGGCLAGPPGEGVSSRVDEPPIKSEI